MTPENHLTYQILNAPIRPWPYIHCYIENVFPESFYREILDHMPPADSYDYDEFGSKPHLQNTGEIHRSCIRLTPQAHGFPDDGFWQEWMGWFMSPRLMNVLLGKFRPLVEKRFEGQSPLFYPRGLLSKDAAGYSLTPHADQTRKIITAVFYLPEESQDDLGTSLYTLHDDVDGSTLHPLTHHDRKYFDLVATAPYRRNSMLMFFKTDHSWHGVEETDVERRSIQLQVIEASDKEIEMFRKHTESVSASS